MLGTVLNGSLGLLGLWADCKVGKSNPVVFSSLSLLKKKTFLYASPALTMSTQVHACCTACKVSENYVWALFILAAFFSKTARRCFSSHSWEFAAPPAQQVQLSCTPNAPFVLCHRIHSRRISPQNSAERKLLHIHPARTDKVILILMCPPNSAL